MRFVPTPCALRCGRRPASPAGRLDTLDPCTTLKKGAGNLILNSDMAQIMPQMRKIMRTMDPEAIADAVIALQAL